MPNHLHDIIVINPYGSGDGSRTVPTGIVLVDGTKHKLLGRLIGAFKTVSTKQINIARGMPGIPVWQRNYYEHIIRNEKALINIRRYIAENPLRWASETELPVIDQS